MSMDDEAHQASIFQSALQLNGTSELGLKSHWESEFADDLHQFLDTVDGDKPLPADFNDDREVGGHCWFGIDVARRMVDFIASYCTRDDMTIVDVGTGNGDVIFRLAETLALKGIKPKFIGVDYCEDAYVLIHFSFMTLHIVIVSIRIHYFRIPLFFKCPFVSTYSYY
jgi:hypothetical protein